MGFPSTNFSKFILVGGMIIWMSRAKNFEKYLVVSVEQGAMTTKGLPMSLSVAKISLSFENGGDETQ